MVWRPADIIYREGREDTLMADIFLAAAEDQRYLEAVDAKRQGLDKNGLKRLPTEHGARKCLSGTTFLCLMIVRILC